MNRTNERTHRYIDSERFSQWILDEKTYIGDEMIGGGDGAERVRARARARAKPRCFCHYHIVTADCIHAYTLSLDLYFIHFILYTHHLTPNHISKKEKRKIKHQPSELTLLLQFISYRLDIHLDSFLSFPFLSFPFLSFPFLSFSFLASASFILSPFLFKILAIYRDLGTVDNRWMDG